MRAEAAINGRQRPLYFASPRLTEALDAYLLERMRLGHGLGIPGKCRGLDPASRLFLTAGGQALPIRVRDVKGRRHHRCGAILDIYRRLFAHAGLKGVSALSARRTAAQRLAQRGCDPKQIAELLGVRNGHAVRCLIAKSAPALKAVVKELV